MLVREELFIKAGVSHYSDVSCKELASIVTVNALGV